MKVELTHSGLSRNMALCLMLFVILFLPSCGSTGRNSPSINTPEERPSQENTIVTIQPTVAPTEAIEPTEAPSIGDTIRVGNIEWKVLEARNTGAKLEASTNDNREVTISEGAFVWVRYEITNAGQGDVGIRKGNVVLKDDSNQEYQGHDNFDPITRANVIKWLPEEESCPTGAYHTLRLDPGNTVICQEVFIVPSDIKGLHLQVSDLASFSSETVLIRLDL